MTPPKISRPQSLKEAADNLVDAAEKLRDHGKRIDQLGWPRDEIVGYTLLRNAVNRAVEAYDAMAQQRRREAHKAASAARLKLKELG